MRQVPHYLIIGNGRVARHIQYYFSLLRLSCTSWHRQEALSKLHQERDRATHILLLISDRAIECFVAEYLSKFSSMLIHFSGSVVSEHVFGAHPLMTFSESLYDLEHYQAIPFILDHDAPTMDKLLPGLPNQHVRLHTSQKQKYHALCVLSGNFSCMLWQKFFHMLENEFNIPRSIAYLYLQQQTKNLVTHAEYALTGPLVRGDKMTIEKNLLALNNDPFQAVYKSFIACYQKMIHEEVRYEHI